MSPDLEVRITSPSLDQAGAERIADAEWPPNALAVKASQRELLIGAHDILDDKADWNSETWLFAATGVSRFIRTLERLYDLLPEQFELIAAWGDKPSREESVTRTQLMTILSNNALGNAVLYRVSAQ